jgi:hypothetical protein
MEEGGSIDSLGLFFFLFQALGHQGRFEIVRPREGKLKGKNHHRKPFL